LHENLNITLHVLCLYCLFSCYGLRRTQSARPTAHTCIRAALYREMSLSLRVLSNFSVVESEVTQSAMDVFVGTAER
jgi:hypothetical protein